MKSSATWFSSRKGSCKSSPPTAPKLLQGTTPLLTLHGWCRLHRYISSAEGADCTLTPSIPRSPGPGKEAPADRAVPGKGKGRGKEFDEETRKTVVLSQRDPSIPSGADSQFAGTGTPAASRPPVDPYWPAEHLSGSEPKIYPGVVSRGQRSNSTRQGDK